MTRKRIALLGALCVVAAAAAGCTAPQDRLVERHSTHLEADLRVRGRMARAGIERQFESFRELKHAEIDAAHDGALAALEAAGKLTADSARKAADRFAGLHRELDRLADLAKAAALEDAKWFDVAADTVAATTAYYQAKDQAGIEGAKAALEAFSSAYFSTRDDPAKAAQEAPALMDSIHRQLVDMLAGRLGVMTQ